MMSASILPKLIPVEQYYDQIFNEANEKPSLKAFKKWAKSGQLPHPARKMGMDWYIDLSSSIELFEPKPRNKKSATHGSILSMIMADK